MDLVGRKLGNYEIVDEIGRGGMAVVYRAYQRSLNRHVAIKVLAPQLSVDQQFVERFQREARAAAGLRHPHVVVIHDVAQEQGIYYIVMEYLEGRSLKELIQEEQSLSPKRATSIVEQVASALDYAHEQGFVHRDIKPANILVGKNDHITLTDFGIAKAASETQHLTRTGMLIGTPEYMSPEQAEGGTVDHRTDLYALGVVLYQMLTGRAPFHSTTPHATLHAVIYEPPPPVRRLRPSLSPAIESVVMRSISKQPASRYQNGSDMVAALQAAQSGQPTVAVAAPPSTPTKDSRPQKSLAVPIAAGAAVVLVVIAVAIILLLRGDGGQETPTPVATSIATEGTAVVTEAVMITEAVPTDEATTTSVATDTQPPPTQVPPQSTATSEPPTDALPPPTETPAPTTDTPPPQPAAFGRLAFSSNRHGNPEIYVVDLAGGSPVRLTQNNANDWLPDWSADGTKITFTSYRTGSYDLWVMRADGSAQTSWVATGAWDDYPRWAPDGERISLSTTAETEGVPNSEIFVRRLNGSLQQVTYSVAEDQWADWSPDERIIFTEGYKDGSDWDIYIIDADGSNRTTWLDDTDCDVQPTWSPDGNWIAFLRITKDTNGSGSIDFEDAGDIWVGRATGGGLQQLTSSAWALTPTWSPDSEWVAFAQVRDSNNNGRSDQNDTVNIWAVPRSGGEAVPLVQSPNRDGDPSWTW
ncbi:MAG: protein kinase [Anaerolineae bacterium]|jgi:serine/threonine-protein kinase